MARGAIEPGRAGILISDRMITGGDIQYEPQQRKVAQIATNVMISIAGEFGIHSQALKETIAQLRGNLHPQPYNVALICGQAIQALKRKQAEDLYLAPLGLNTDSFMSQQNEMSDGLTNALLERLQSYRGEEVQAIVIGVSQPDGAIQSSAQIYTVDTIGTVSCSDDIGFAAIGIGAWHARSLLMQRGYINIWPFAPALAALYAAKKGAEVAPGVGRATDIQIILRDGTFPLWDMTHRKLNELYDNYTRRSAQLAQEDVEHLNASFTALAAESAKNVEAQGPSSRDQNADESASEPSPEAPQQNEDRNEKEETKGSLQ